MSGRLICAALVMTASLPGEAQVPPPPSLPDHRMAGSSRGMTVDEIVALASFADVDAAGSKVSISPDGRFLIAIEERPTSDREMVQASLLLWKKADLDQSGEMLTRRPSPTRLGSFTSVDGPVISSIRWADDSSSIVALVNEGQNHQALWRVTLTRRKQRVSLPAQNVRSFDFAESTIVYTASATSPIDGTPRDPILGPPATQVSTGKALQDLLFPTDTPDPSQWVDIWRWSGVRPIKVGVAGAIRPSEDRNPLALSPDGKEVILDFPVKQVPDSWSRFAVDTRLNVTAGWKSGPQHFTNVNGLIPHQFAVLQLETGVATPLADGPDAQSRGFLLPSTSLAVWSSDGSHVAISATFLPGHSKPCVAVVDLATRHGSCVTSIAKAFDRIHKLDFVDRSNDQVRIDTGRDGSERSVEVFQFNRASLTWGLVSISRANAVQANRFYVNQDINHPPSLVDGQRTGDREIYNPNPQLDMARLATWETVNIPVPNGKPIKAGLLLPNGPAPTGGLPLVIQTHGFDPSTFSPSGAYSAPFAAQALVREGFAVVQLPMSCPVGEVAETPCFLKQYKAAISFLSDKGTADRERLAIIGFSRTGIHVLSALTDPTFSFKAAVLQNGYLNTLSQYFSSVDYYDGFVNGWMSKMIGGKPYGQGLPHWMTASPSFNYDHLETPLRVEANGKLDTLFMWEPYAAMRDRRLPADLIVLRQGTHPLTNPAARAASQQGAVDWLAYWVMGKKDPSPAKEVQYQRWESMKRDVPKK